MNHSAAPQAGLDAGRSATRPDSAAPNPTRIYAAGYHDLVSVIPPGAHLSASSNVKQESLGKVPGKKGWRGWHGYNWLNADAPTAEDLERWEEWGANVGQRSSKWPAIDIDVDHPVLSQVVQARVEEHLGKAPVRTSHGARRLLVYRASEPFGKIVCTIEYEGRTYKVEVLADGQQYVVFGAHPSGTRYGWEGRPLSEWVPDDIPIITPEHLRALFDDLGATLAPYGAKVATGSAGRGEGAGRSLSVEELARYAAPGETPEERVLLVRQAVPAIPNDEQYDDRSAWVGMAHLIRTACGADAGEEARAIFEEFSARYEGGEDPAATAHVWDTLPATTTPAGYDRLLDRACAHGYELPPDHPYRPENEFDADPDAVPAPPPPLILKPGDPYPGAKRFLDREFTEDGVVTLRHHRGCFHAFNGACYRPMGDEEVRARLWKFADGALRTDQRGRLVRFQPTKSKINNLLDAVQACTRLDDNVSAPAWLDEGEKGAAAAAANLVPLENGLLEVGTRHLLPHSPRFYGHHVLPVEYAPAAGDPRRWLSFLRELWGDDQESIDTLQEIFGYALLPDTSQQKAFLLVGPKRSGKGTIARVLTALLGPDNVCAPTLGDLSKNFMLAPLIGKPLAIVSDARLSGRADQAPIAERILQITGEDTVTLDRKFQDAWTGRLPTRFLILSNELPRLADASGALPSRFIVLELRKSFFGKEDTALTEKLLPELPAIFNWALEGLDRLRERGHFLQPTSANESIQEMEDLASPVAAFVREVCVVGAGQSVFMEDLYSAWGNWCSSNGRRQPGTKASFGRDLRAAVPGLGDSRPGVGRDRKRMYEGIGLVESPASEPWPEDLTADLCGFCGRSEEMDK